MENKNIATFIKVVECNNFTKAAEQLGYSQAAVTVQIKSLETELGVRLFDRIGKRIFLTQEGKTFLPYALNMLKAEQEALQSVQPKEDLTGELRICSASSYASEVLPHLLLSYQQAHPHVYLTVKVSDYVEDTIRRLAQGEIDFLLCLDEVNAHPGFLSTEPVREPIIFVTHCSNPILKKKVPRMEDIVANDFIVSDRDIGYCGILERNLRKAKIDYQPAMELGSTSAIVKMLLEGYGISFLPEFVVAGHLASGELVQIPSKLEIELYSYFLYSKDRWIDPVMQAFIDLCNQASGASAEA